MLLRASTCIYSQCFTTFRGQAPAVGENLIFEVEVPSELQPITFHIYFTCSKKNPNPVKSPMTLKINNAANKVERHQGDM